MLHLDKISKSYRQDKLILPILENMSLKIDQGEILAIVGASGSGKSTLLNIMGLLDPPDAGGIYLDGQSIHDAGEQVQAELRNRHFGFVFQSFNLLPHLSALDNVGLPLLYRGTAKTQRRRIAAGLLERVGLSERMHHFPDALSGGQKQRVAIARALIAQPRILLADEPTGNLDPQAAAGVLDLLAVLNREAQVSIAIVTHDASVSARAHRVLRVERNGVAAGPA